MAENIHLLRHEIHSSFETGLFATGAFESRISTLPASYPTGDSQNFHIFTRVIQELNKRLDQLNLSSNISNPTDAGKRPLNFEDFFGDASPSVGLSDFLELENDDFIFQENGFKLILEQDV